jgi:Ca2+-binding EF-hand superfamily protein
MPRCSKFPQWEPGKFALAPMSVDTQTKFAIHKVLDVDILETPDSREGYRRQSVTNIARQMGGAEKRSSITATPNQPKVAQSKKKTESDSPQALRAQMLKAEQEKLRLKLNRLNPLVSLDDENTATDENFSPEKVRILQDSFIQVCGSADGFINSRLKLRRCLNKVGIGNALLDDNLLTHIYRAMDADGSGDIDFNEFTVAATVLLAGSFEAKCSFNFDIYDVDADGSLDKGEMFDMLLTTLNRMAKLVDQMHPKLLEGNWKKRNGLFFQEHVVRDLVESAFRSADVDNSGTISKEEYVAWAAKNPVVATCSDVLINPASFMAAVNEIMTDPRAAQESLV